jgi:hypothetical protein
MLGDKACILMFFLLNIAQLALLEAEAHGEDWKSLGLEQAPHFMERDGSIQVPTKWRYMLQRAKDKITNEEPAGTDQ